MLYLCQITLHLNSHDDDGTPSIKHLNSPKQANQEDHGIFKQLKLVNTKFWIGRNISTWMSCSCPDSMRCSFNLIFSSFFLRRENSFIVDLMLRDQKVRHACIGIN